MNPFLCHTEDSVLLIVDMQDRLSASMSKDELESVQANSIRLIDAANILGIPVLLTEQYPQGLGPTGAELAGRLPENTRAFEKTGFSCYAADGFSKKLNEYQRRQVILTGQEAHVCVLQTALELLNLNFQVFVVEDAIISRKTEHKLNALQRMRHHGITITNHESVLFEWLKDASHPDFKKISGMLR